MDGDSPHSEVKYSYAIQAKTSLDITIGGAVDYTWNSFRRLSYERIGAAIQRQANALLDRGNVTFQEARELVEVQRNGLLISVREDLTPYGKYYSEILKPTASLKSLDQFLAEKGSIEAVLRSVGKSRQAVNRVAFIARRAGPSLIVIDVVLTMVIIEQAPAEQRALIAAGEAGGIAGSVVGARYGGLAGAWAGATTFAALGSPSLAIPLVGEITEGGAVVIGGFVGFFFGGLLGWSAGHAGGTMLWQQLPTSWKTP
ncbi:hypothetical protein [Nitrospirillum sp. BR 11828]|uniref:hypothetical protein n=1 Tax=Nitrospirillum sp. BR 11828 TaxID=3104325 RepID=UPI002ACA46FE|nr:hypothetical protein [Nitrospirillum sp. BR 11828]MDZ5648159.1 hypothetical protein [Nitrospirillum sp. BR 11828]